MGLLNVRLGGYSGNKNTLCPHAYYGILGQFFFSFFFVSLWSNLLPLTS